MLTLSPPASIWPGWCRSRSRGKTSQATPTPNPIEGVTPHSNLSGVECYETPWREAVQQVQSSYGKGSLMNLGDSPIAEGVEVISSHYDHHECALNC